MADTEKAPERPQLTVRDPIDPDTLSILDRLEGARYDIGLKLLRSEQERVKLLAAAHRVDEQQQRTFERILMERGLAPNVEMEIDTKTGRITLLQPESPDPEAEKPE